MPSLRIEIDQASYDSLVLLALQDRRPPKMQAEWMLIEILREAMVSREGIAAEHTEVCGHE